MTNEKQADIFDIEKIKQLVELMKQNDISDIDLQEGSSRIQLQRKMNVVTTVNIPEAPVALVKAPEAVSSSVSAVAPVDESFIQTIKSSLVGTFYDSPNPDASPYVKIGDIVSAEQTICIIEAMKVFNEIQPEISGKVVSILAHSGQAVEYGTPLFKVDTRG